MLEPAKWTIVGLGLGVFLIVLESKLRSVSVRGLSSMVFGLLLGVFMAKLISDILLLLPLGDFVHSVARVVLTVIFSYLGAVMALRGKDEFNIIIPYVRFRRQEVHEEVVLLDTSAIIDGRVSDVFKTHFISGRMVVPRFVIQELHTISDSSDDLKRQRGRRGLELLRIMQGDPKVDVHIHEDQFTGDEDVDTKIIRLARMMDAAVCTTDFNMTRAASLRGVKILNIQELANAVKSVIYPGESLSIKLVKEGKEKGQALGYLEDGTMIVVSSAQDKIGDTVSVVVTSLLQTQTGKMVFAKLSDQDKS